MSKDPAFLFYSSDFLTGTIFMSDEQVGKYIRLLCAQHQKGRLHEKDMLKICKTHDNDVFEKFKKDKNGLYYNERLENESIKRKKYSESRRKNRLSKPIKENTSKTYDKHMENENENENINVDETEILIWPTFEDFWNTYDKKIGSKDKCEIKFNKLKQETKEEIMNHIFEYVKETPDKKFRANPETYLNQKRWENEIIKNGESAKEFTKEFDKHLRETDPDYQNY